MAERDFGWEQSVYQIVREANRQMRPDVCVRQAPKARTDTSESVVPALVDATGRVFAMAVSVAQ